MTRKEFDRILIKEGIKSKTMRDDLWRGRPTDDLEEERLRKTAQAFKRTHPRACQ